MATEKKLAPVPIRLEPELRAQLDALANADNRSLSAYIRLVLRSHVEREQSKASRRR